MINNDDFHRFRRPQDSRVGLDRERVLYNSQPIVPSQSLGSNPSSPPSVESRLLLSLVKFRDLPVNPPLGPSANHQTDSKPPFIRESLISETALRSLPGLHERVFVAAAPTSRIEFSPPGSSLLLSQPNPMENDRFQGQLSQSSDQPTAGNYPPSSDHMSTATSNVNLTATSPAIDPSASSYSPAVVPRGRPPRLGASVSNYRSIHSKHPHAPPQQSALSPTSSPYYTPQQPQAQNSGGQPQQQHYMTQPMSPTIYYPTFSHMHQQASSPNAYNVNQGYMGPVPTSAGPSMPVTSYAYSHPYAAHVSEHTLHPFAYTGPVGGISTAPLPHYPELDAQAHQQQMQNRGGNIDMMAGYVPVITTTGPPFAYSIPAYVPTGGSIFTPQYSGGHPYSYAPQQSQPFPTAYGQTPQGPRPPPLSLSQQQAPMQGSSSQVGLDLPPGPPSPLMFPNTNQGTPSGYSPIVVSPSPGLNAPRRLDFIGRSTSGSSSFGLGLNPGVNTPFSAYGSNSAASSGETFALDHMGRAVGSTCSPVPVAVDLVGPSPDGGGAQSQEPATQRNRERTTHGIVTGSRQDRPEQQQTSTKGERSDWVMWVGNVPGDASLNELYSFFGQGPPIPEAERTAAGGDDLANIESLPQVEGAALVPRTRDETSVADTDTAVGVGGLSGVVSVFLISRSNCAFVNYVSEASLQRGVDYFNGRPLRNPQVDPRCPKLVCRVRKKGDDIKAGVGGQRGVGTHARWVKEKKAAEIGNLSPTEGDKGLKEYPPFVHGGPAGNAKKSSSGSSGSYASTTSSMLMRHFPSRYFILKSLTQHDLDLSVERGLWATQVHNQEVLDQAYRTSQNVYLIFGVNKSGEFFGYAKMDGPISQVERNPSIEWASRDSFVSPGSAKLSPSAVRGAPSQPNIQEEKERENLEHEEQQGLALPPTEDKKSSVHSSDDVATARGDENVPRAASVPFKTSGSVKHESLPHHQVSEPIQPRQHEAHEGLFYDRFAQNLRSMSPRVAEISPRSSKQSEPVVSPTRRVHPSMAHLFPGTTLQDSPDPLTPGEDQKLHSLDSLKISSSSARSSQPRTPQTDAPDNTRSQQESERESSGFSIASAPAVMGRRYKPLSASTPIAPSGTWDEVRKGAIMWPKEHSIEEEAEETEDIIIPPSTSQSLPAEGLLAFAATEQSIQPTRLEIPPTPLAMPHLDTPDIHPAQPGFDTQQPKEGKPASEAPATVGGREEGWGTPFKVKWLRTDPLSFHRTRHLRNPWNHDREIKVSRDGTEVEPGVGQRLLEEWDRTDAAPMAGRVGVPPRSPISLRGPPSPNQAFISRGRGRGRGMTGGWVQRDTGQ